MKKRLTTKIRETMKVLSDLPGWQIYKMAEDDIKNIGYAGAHCYDFERNGEYVTVECVAVSDIPKNIARKLNIETEEDKKNIIELILHHNAEPFSEEPLTEEEFIKRRKLGERPLGVPPLSFTEMNMIITGIYADALRHGINPYKAKKLQKAIEKSKNMTLYSSWSGD